MSEKWVVLVEAEGDPAREAIDADAVRRLVRALDPGSQGGALHCPERYAVQLTAAGASPIDALTEVVSRWATAVRQLDLPAWKLVRAEVFTLAELERQFDSAQRDEVVPDLPVPGSPRKELDDPGRELLRHAFSDALTGLVGREAFVHQLDLVLQAGGDGGATAAVLLDLDGFRSVNKVFGTTTCDRLLIALAERLTAVLRPGDGLARVGGDVYAVVLEDTTAQAALAVAQRMVDAVALPITIAGDDFTLSGSAGVAVSEPGDDAPAMIGRAEAALTAAKEAGGGRALLHQRDVAPSRDGRGERARGPLEDRLAQLLLMHEVAVATNGAETLTDAAQTVMAQFCAHIGCAVGRLCPSPPAHGPEQPGPVWHIANGGDDQALRAAIEELLARPGVDLGARVLATARPVWFTDLIDGQDVGAESHGDGAAFASAFALPVVAGHEVVAALEFFSLTRIEVTDSFLDVLASVGAQLGRVAERERLVATLRRSEEQRREAERRLREAQALAGLGSWEFDLRTGESRWSEGMQALFGLDPGQHLSLDATIARVHVVDRARAREMFSRLVQSGEPTAEEIRVVLADGRVRRHRCEGAAIRDERGAIVAISGTNQDISEREVTDEVLPWRAPRRSDATRAASLGGTESDQWTGPPTWSDQAWRPWGA